MPADGMIAGHCNDGEFGTSRCQLGYNATSNSRGRGRGAFCEFPRPFGAALTDVSARGCELEEIANLPRGGQLQTPNGGWLQFETLDAPSNRVHLDELNRNPHPSETRR